MRWPRMLRSVRRSPETRQSLIDRKHATATEIRQLQHEARALRRRGEPTDVIEAHIRTLQAEHQRLRIEIDRARTD